VTVHDPPLAAFAPVHVGGAQYVLAQFSVHLTTFRSYATVVRKVPACDGSYDVELEGLRSAEPRDGLTPYR
jgi:hypothetical protein